MGDGHIGKENPTTLDLSIYNYISRIHRVPSTNSLLVATPYAPQSSGSVLSDRHRQCGFRS
ncbi:Fc.00g084020.m01.CDS01 [Cosmosporella sp. VM-42]